jgi:hypothetical protein
VDGERKNSLENHHNAALETKKEEFERKETKKMKERWKLKAQYKQKKTRNSIFFKVHED